MFDDVISQSQQSMAGWGKLWQHQLERLDQASHAAARLQDEGAVRTAEVIDELAKLGKASLDYANRLSAQWRHVGLEAFRRGAETVTATPATATPATATPATATPATEG